MNIDTHARFIFDRRQWFLLGFIMWYTIIVYVRHRDLFITKSIQLYHTSCTALLKTPLKNTTNGHIISYQRHHVHMIFKSHICHAYAWQQPTTTIEKASHVWMWWWYRQEANKQTSKHTLYDSRDIAFCQVKHLCWWWITDVITCYSNCKIIQINVSDVFSWKSGKKNISLLHHYITGYNRQSTIPHHHDTLIMRRQWSTLDQLRRP